jgi:hypothetical protein
MSNDLYDELYSKSKKNKLQPWKLDAAHINLSFTHMLYIYLTSL